MEIRFIFEYRESLFQNIFHKKYTLKLLTLSLLRGLFLLISLICVRINLYIINSERLCDWRHPFLPWHAKLFCWILGVWAPRPWWFTLVVKKAAYFRSSTKCWIKFLVQWGVSSFLFIDIITIKSIKLPHSDFWRRYLPGLIASKAEN
jgi:hypothetical protein